ncbi:MAG TPA: hypothetical protein VMG10_16395 [Gemmataceae bacterium]|nr:hypothetical protein [Gemmataceae bacterium]
MSEQPLPDAPSGNATDGDDHTYYIDDSLTVMGQLTACNKCGRTILVEMALIGVQHHVGLTATCGECLMIPQQFRKEHPQIAAKIDRWLQGVKANKQDQS